MDSKSALLKNLRREILSLGGIKPPAGPHLSKNGLQKLAAHFPFGVFPTAAVHEFLSDSPEQLAASTGFIASLVNTCLPDDALIVWINTTQHLFPHSLIKFGIQPHTIIFVHPANQKETNWCVEEALQCDRITAVVSEMKDLNFTNSRRFQLAVEKSKVTCFIINLQPIKLQTTACVTRWQIIPAPSELPDGMPGVGHPKWKVQLQKVRNGKPGKWDIAWINNQFSLTTYQPIIITEQEHLKTG